MYRVIACLTDQHDFNVIGLAAIICVVAAVATFWILSNKDREDPAKRGLLVLLAAIAAAAGIWSTHFIAMLAYDPGLPVRYDIALTLLSLAIAVVGSFAGLAMLSGRSVAMGFDGGAILGVSIAAMHFTGMAAVNVGGTLTWEVDLVVASVVAGAIMGGLSGAAFKRFEGRRGLVIATVFFTLAVCAMHFTAMGALTVTPHPNAGGTQLESDPRGLALLVAVVSTMIILASAGASLVARFTIARGLIAFGVAVFAALFGAIGISAYTLEQLRIGGPNYSRIAAGKDLVADILPPPAYIIEAYLATHRANDQPGRLAEYVETIARLRNDYERRIAIWREAPTIPAEIKRTLTDESDRQVQYFWWELDNGFVPALERGDRAAAAQSFDRMTANFLAHRSIIEDVVTKSTAFTEQIESGVATQMTLLSWLVTASVLVVLGMVVGAILLLRKFVIRPVIHTSSYLHVLSNGDYTTPAPHATRDDEIGMMAKAIETLRLAALEKLRLEAEMAKKSKLAQLGQLTATVAHEIRNPLGAVKTAAFLIDRKTKDKGLGIENQMQRINNGIQRCDTIITELLDFTRTKSLATTSQSVDEWVAGVIAEERKGLPAEVRLVCEPGVGEARCQFDTGRMRRVLINLVSNAAEAMVGKGNDPSMRMTVNPCIRIRTKLVDGMVEIEVADNGPGISPENIKKIREPLFTTKSFGVGLGIPAVENILTQHGGSLRIDSILGQGATFTAAFPFLAEEAAVAASATLKVA